MNSPGHSDPCRCEHCRTGCGHPVIALEDVFFRRDGREILSDINFTIDQGDFLAITGPNGGGKTTLLRLILRLLRPSSGKIAYYNTEGRPAQSLRFGYLPQKNSIDSQFPVTVREVIASGLLCEKNMDRAQKDRAIAAALSEVDLAPLADRSIGRLSGGQLQRAMLGRAIVRKPSVLVLDEPLSYLDKTFEHRLYPLIRDIAKEATVLLVSHEMTQIAAMAGRHIIVDHTLTECTAAHHYFSMCRNED